MADGLWTDDWTWAKENLAPTPVAKRTGKPKTFTPHQLLPSAVKRLKRTTPRPPARPVRVSLGRSTSECGFCGSSDSSGLVKCQHKSCGVLCETCDAVFHAPPERSGHLRTPVRPSPRRTPLLEHGTSDTPLAPTHTSLQRTPLLEHGTSDTPQAATNASLRPFCDNDLCEFATVHCAACAQHFCAACDHVLHLNPKMLQHQRTAIVFNRPAPRHPQVRPGAEFADVSLADPITPQRASPASPPTPAPAHLATPPRASACTVGRPAALSHPFMSPSPMFRGHFSRPPAQARTGPSPSLLARKFRLQGLDTPQSVMQMTPGSFRQQASNVPAPLDVAHLCSASDAELGARISRPGLHAFKILVVGNPKCGKSSLVGRFSGAAFSSAYHTTVGADFSGKTIAWDAETTVRLQLWDIAGQDRFATLTRPFFAGAAGALVVCDVTRPATVEAAKMWKVALDKCLTVPVILVANKVRLFFLSGPHQAKHRRADVFFWPGCRATC